MKLLLTSGGITNDTLALELARLAGKEFKELNIGFIPTAAFVDPNQMSWLALDEYRLLERGAKLYIISLADLTPEEIASRLQSLDVILVGGGNTFYLSYMMQEKGMFTILPKLLETKVYVGISAGSMLATATVRTASQVVTNPHIGDDELDKLGPADRSSARTLHIVPFALRPHLNTHLVDEIQNGALEKIAAETGLTIYAIDDNCAVSVENDLVSIVGEGESKIITP